MTTLPILTAAALTLALAQGAQAAPSPRLSGTSSLVIEAGCYDECEYYREAIREAREEAAEEAAEAAAEYAEEMEEYGYRPRRAKRRQARKPTPMAAAKRVAPAKSSEADKGPSSDSKEAAPKTSDKKKDVAVNSPGGCKQYFPATGITLSVPCE